MANKNVVVIGLGKSGVAAARYLAKLRARVTVMDLKSADELKDSLKALDGLCVSFKLGTNDPEFVSSADMIVLSPGVPAGLPGLDEAKAKGIQILGEMELAVREINKPVIAVTGTNGKTTTTALLGHLLNNSGLKTCVAGNIGTPVLDVIGEANRAEVVVLEVSSFQLETTPSLKPHVGIVLNITPDHLDRHINFDSYAACKMKIFSQISNDGWGVYNMADKNITSRLGNLSCRALPFEAERKISGSPLYAAWREGEGLYVRTGSETNHYSLKAAKLKGVHNVENMLAALSAAQIAGARRSKLKQALFTFEGLPHRVVFVGKFSGVEYYDDSKGTNVGAVIRAVSGFEKPVVLIAGGLSKGVDFAPLAREISGRLKALVLIGEAASDMKRVFGGRVRTVMASAMDDAVKKASALAEAGDVVLLSPACASFDMFRDYAHRGDEFVKAVRTVARR